MFLCWFKIFCDRSSKIHLLVLVPMTSSENIHREHALSASLGAGLWPVQGEPGVYHYLLTNAADHEAGLYQNMD